MTLQTTLRDYIDACFGGIWIETREPDEAMTEITALCEEQHWKCATWSLEEGVRHDGKYKTIDPLGAVRHVATLADGETPAILVLRNYHRFAGNIEILSAMERQIQRGKQMRTFLIVLAPVVQIPLELEKLFVVIEHELPDRPQLLRIAEQIATEEGELPQGEELDKLLDAAAGLTRYEAENAFSLSLIRHKKLSPPTLWELKANTLKGAGLLQLYRNGTERFASLGGLDSMKRFCLRALSSQRGRAKGILLLGVPGTGKSAFCKALGAEVNRPTLILDIGALMGSLVGQTEANLRKTLKQIDAMSPSVVMIDEVEKALSGAGGQGDGGVATRLFGTLLSWLQDKKSDSFVVCTCNDISQLPPEFARAERFDAVFFLDLPSEEQRRRIWDIYRAEFQIGDTDIPDDKDWTGAEIRSCCRLATLHDLLLIEASRYVVPLALTAAEKIAALRSWASSRCLDSETPGLFSVSGDKDATIPKRKRNLCRK